MLYMLYYYILGCKLLYVYTHVKTKIINISNTGMISIGKSNKFLLQLVILEVNGLTTIVSCIHQQRMRPF